MTIALYSISGRFERFAEYDPWIPARPYLGSLLFASGFSYVCVGVIGTVAAIYRSEATL